MATQSPDFHPRWVLGSLPEDPAVFQKVLAGRLHALESWVRAAHSRINFTQPWAMQDVQLANTFNFSTTSFVDVGSPVLQLSFTSAIRAQALVLAQVDITATAASSIATIEILTNGVTQDNTGIVVAELANTERKTVSTWFPVQLAAATAYTIKMRAMANAGSFQLLPPRTKLALIGFPASYTLP
jgi:hypothetical protein